MEKSNKQIFHELILEWITLIDSLSEEERKVLNLTIEDYDEYERNYFTSTSNGTMKEIEDEYAAAEGIRTMQRNLRHIKEEVVKFRAQKEKKSANLTPVQILARYLKLPDIWKKFVRRKIGSIKIGLDDNDTVEIFANMKNDHESNLMLENLDALLSEIEKAR